MIKSIESVVESSSTSVNLQPSKEQEELVELLQGFALDCIHLNNLITLESTKLLK